MRVIFAALCVCFLTAPALAGSYDGTLNITVKRLPRFSDYPATEEGKAPGERPPLNLASHEHANEYRTKLTKAYERQANFAGRYVLEQIGCGAGCQTNWILDTATGAIAGTAGSVYGVSFSNDSAMLVTNFENSASVTVPFRPLVFDFLVIEDGKLATIRTVDMTGLRKGLCVAHNDGAPCAESGEE